MGRERPLDQDDDHDQVPLLEYQHAPPRSPPPSSDHFKRTGSYWTAIAHVITAVIGSGVLSLAWSTAQLGWIAGPIALLSLAGITVVSVFLLSDCYRSPDPEFGVIRNGSYTKAVKFYLGKKSLLWCGVILQTNFFGNDIAYVMTAANSMRAIHISNCYHYKGHEAPCDHGVTFYMLVFGASQIVFSQIPNFHDMEWLSIIAAIMSFCYASVGFSLGFAKVIENGTIKGSIGGIPQATVAKKVWKVCQALGDIAFAYPFSTILLEIQDTLRSPPAENKTMKKASLSAVFITTFFYFCCGSFGYAAFGNQTPGNLLTGFGFYEPYWLIDFANVCVIIHLVGGYQMFCQPVFAFMEAWLAEKYPNNGFINKSYTFKVPLLPSLNLSPFRLCTRTFYVATTTGIAITFPYFNQVLGVMGSLTFWPLIIYFPVQMYFVQLKVVAWTRKWVILQTFSTVCLIISTTALIGSIEGIISAKLE
ncbi:probable amino acid permease 7 [Papaver somniferum]|uniref:probable amino acid permease 7 n=1 Tax=Papaver somniferum TaxID=3469 RepID=UPI000E6FA7D9|nr:probable amino acid permease 7 [Papaver somniferum]